MTWLQWLGASQPPPLWAQLLQAAAVTALAIFGGYIAYRQWRTAHEKLRLDLLDRRLAVFDDFRQLMHRMRSLAKANHEDIALSWDIDARAIFLFGESVTKLTKELREIGADLHVFAETRADIPLEQRAARSEKVLLRLNQLQEISETYKSEFSKFMDFSDITRR